MTQNLAVSSAIIERLIQWGVTHFVVSPGSRSTPLTVAVARNLKAKTTIHYDERGAAYFALGHAKATGKPAVLICTSGTAVANYFPAVVEASMDNIPLFILSADRPPELIGVGANQAIFQDNIYGIYPRLTRNLPPTPVDSSELTFIATVDECYRAAMGARPGPVQLNCQFREPLLPVNSETDVSFTLDLATAPEFKFAAEAAPDTAIPSEAIHAQIKTSSRGLIIVGRSVDSSLCEDILALADSLYWPIFADVQSNLRFSEHPNVINHFDLDLLNNDCPSEKPDTIIHLGSAFTSKRLLSYINDPDIFYVSVKTTPEKVDPNHQIDIAVQSDIRVFCKNFIQAGLSTSSKWLEIWQDLDLRTSQQILEMLKAEDSLNEPGISFQLSELIPDGHSLMLANSMAVREMDMFAAPNPTIGKVFANRGASGIDGLMATAAGYQSASNKPLTLLIGDLAFLHDLNSLLLIKNSRQPVIIVVINNDGGGIFNFLPVRAEKDVFEPYFGTPHGLTFQKAAELFNLPYTKPKDMNEFTWQYSQLISNSESAVIEVRTDRDANHEFHQRMFDLIREA